eukprot:562467-Amphidinium_carterae.1
MTLPVLQSVVEAAWQGLGDWPLEDNAKLLAELPPDIPREFSLVLAARRVVDITNLLFVCTVA